MIFFVPVSFILMVLLCIVAAGYAVFQNIGAILATIILICVFLFFFFRWPAETFGALLAMGIIGLVCMSVSDHWDEKNKVENSVVKVYIASDECKFYDEADNLIVIPCGATVARYRHPEQKCSEPQYDGNAQMCEWYFNGDIFSATISIKHQSMSKEYNVEKNIWNLEKVSEITYKDLKKGEWWELVFDNEK